jgi:hypothetical protein
MTGLSIKKRNLRGEKEKERKKKRKITQTDGQTKER